MNHSSLIDLKAILFKKEQEAAQISNKNIVKLKGGGEKWKKLAKELELRNKVKELIIKSAKEKDDEKKKKIDDEIEKALKLSREMLEKKAKLYEDKMNQALNGIFEDESNDDTSHNNENNEDGKSLVNFDEKALIEIKKIRSKEKEKRKFDQVGEDENDWVEFTDSLKRTRKCLRKDLKYFIEADNNLVKDLNLENKDFKNDPRKDNYNDSGGDNDVDIDDNEKNLRVKDEALHYQKVKHNEVRDHGVGYYQFSTDSEERKQQMQELAKLREQTEKQKLIRAKIKHKKQNLINQRLAKVAARRGLNLEELNIDQEKW